jgi:hypothetical protein
MKPKTTFGTTKIGYRLPEPIQFVSLIVPVNPEAIPFTNDNLPTYIAKLKRDKKAIEAIPNYSSIPNAKSKVLALVSLISALEFAREYLNQIIYKYNQDNVGHPMNLIAAQQALHRYAIQYGAIEGR